MQFRFLGLSILFFCAVLEYSLQYEFVVSELTTINPKPTVARNAAYGQIDHLIYRHGGWNESVRFINELVAFNTDALTWTVLQPFGDVPSPRIGHTITVVGNRYLVLFGGEDSMGLSNDVFVYDTAENVWSMGYSVSSNVPKPRMFHSAASSGDGTIFIMGGTTQVVTDANRQLDVVCVEGVQNGKLMSNCTSHFGTPERVEVWLMNVIKSHGVLQGTTFSMQWELFYYFQPDISTAFDNFAAQLIGDRIYFIGHSDTEQPIRTCRLDYLSLTDPVTMVTENLTSQNCPRVVKGVQATSAGSLLIAVGGCWSRKTLGTICYDSIWTIDVMSTTPKWTRAGQLTAGQRDGFLAHVKPDTLVMIDGQTELSEPDYETALLGKPKQLKLGKSPSLCQLGGCLKRGTCLDGFKCTCQPPWQGLDCSLLPFQPETSVSNPCSGHGYLMDDQLCDCFLGFHGLRCQYGANRCIDDCNGRGKCNSKSQCICTDGYGGVSCNQRLQCPRNCCNRGTCDPIDNKCICDARYVGPSCLLSREEVANFNTLARELRNKYESALQKYMPGGAQEHEEDAADQRTQYSKAVARAAQGINANDTNIEDFFDTSGVCIPALKPMTIQEKRRTRKQENISEENHQTAKRVNDELNPVQILLRGLWNSGYNAYQQIGTDFEGAGKQLEQKSAALNQSSSEIISKTAASLDFSKRMQELKLGGSIGRIQLTTIEKVGCTALFLLLGSLSTYMMAQYGWKRRDALESQLAGEAEPLNRGEDQIKMIGVEIA